MGILNEDFIGNPIKPEYINEGDENLDSDDDLYLIEDFVGGVGGPDAELFETEYIDDDDEYIPEDDDFLSSNFEDDDFLSSNFSDSADENVSESFTGDEEEVSKESSSSSEDKPSDDNKKIDGNVRTVEGTDSVSSSNNNSAA